MVGLHVDTASHAVSQAFGLLEDFLQHEVRIAALLYLAQVDVDGLDGQFLLFAQDADHLQVFAQSDDGDVAILQIDHLVGIFDDGAGIAA